MTDAPSTLTAARNGPLWGARAADWAAIQEATVRDAYAAVLDRLAVGPDTALLDVGCGAGLAAALAAERGARVAGIDAAAALLAIARARVPEGDFREGEMATLPFADASFDVVTGFNAFQYAGDPVAALAEARRVAKPGGTVAILVWGEPAGMAMAGVIAALGPLLPPPPPGTPGPFALSAAEALRGLAERAGLRPETVFDIAAPVRYPDLATALRGLASSGVAARARAEAGEAAVDRAHAAALAPHQGADGAIEIGASYRCLLARVG